MVTEKQLFCLMSTRSVVLLLFLLCALQEQTASCTDDIYLTNSHKYAKEAPSAYDALPQTHKIRRSADDERLQRRIKEIFRLDTEKDEVVLFNKTMLSPKFTFINQSKGDKSYYNKNSSHHSQQQFKVQRSPDGKLNLVVNDVILYLQRPTSAQFTPTTRTTTNKDFVYPTDETKPREPNRDVTTRLNVEKEPICEEESGKSFCTKVVNYPDVDTLEKLLRKDIKRFEPFFSSKDVDKPNNISTRMNGDEYEEVLCDSVSNVIYPMSGLTRDNVKTFIVNLPTLKQAVRIEECSQKDKECKYTDSFPNGYTTKCKQHYIYRHMVVVSENTTVVTDDIQLPSCCICVVVH